MRLAHLPACVAVALSLSGCFFRSTDRTGPSDVYVDEENEGVLIVDWTIDDTKDPNQCVQAQARTIEITVFEDGADTSHAFVQSCEAFATTIALSPGHYGASIVLLDDDGYERTTTLDVDPFTIYSDEDLILPIDFPADSFLL